MFSVHFPWTNYGNGKVSDQWRRSAAGGWFPAMETMSGLPSSHFGLPFLVRLQNLEARQPQRNRRNLMSRNCHQENIGNPIPALAFPGFSLSKRTVVPKILDIPRAQRTALGWVTVVPSGRPGEMWPTSCQLNSCSARESSTTYCVWDIYIIDTLCVYI